jgi:hypothetical protein
LKVIIINVSFTFFRQMGSITSKQQVTIKGVYFT